MHGPSCCLTARHRCVTLHGLRGAVRVFVEQLRRSNQPPPQTLPQKKFLTLPVSFPKVRLIACD